MLVFLNFYSPFVTFFVFPFFIAFSPLFLFGFFIALPFPLCFCLCFSTPSLLWVSSLAYPNLLGTKRLGCWLLIYLFIPTL
jgi:hypothetical protein